jgi:hypothetical protein
LCPENVAIEKGWQFSFWSCRRCAGTLSIGAALLNYKKRTAEAIPLFPRHVSTTDFEGQV